MKESVKGMQLKSHYWNAQFDAAEKLYSSMTTAFYAMNCKI
jgi:hypothetical protein